MSVARSRELIVPLAAIAAVAALTVVAGVLSPPTSSGLPPGASFSKDAEGSAAAYLTLEALDYDVRRSFDSISVLTATPARSVLILADPRERASEQDRRALRAFVAAGGTVLVTGCEGASFLAETAAATGGAITKAREFAAVLPSPLTAGAPRISMASPCTQAELGPPFVSIYGDDRAEVVKAARIGAGLAVWWAGHTPLSNAAIDAPGHLELLLSIVGSRDRAIVWDEFYHGQRRSLWSYARVTPLPWMLAQLGLAALVAAVMYVRRRMPVRETYAESRTSPLEFVETMAALYRRAGSAREAAVTARHRLRRLLADATGLAGTVTDDRLADAAAARFPIDRDELTRALRAADEAGAASLKPDRALPLVRQLQGFAAAVDHRGG